MQDILSDLFNMSFGGGKGQQTKSRGDDVEVKSITQINVMQNPYQDFLLAATEDHFQRSRKRLRESGDLHCQVILPNLPW